MLQSVIYSLILRMTSRWSAQVLQRIPTAGRRHTRMMPTAGRRFRTSLLLLGLLLGLLTGSVFGQTLRFAPLPMQDPETVVREVRPMLAYLSRELGVEVAIDYSTSYDEVLERFRGGEVDLAYLGPLPYVLLREQYPHARPLVAFREPGGDALYTCSVVMFADDRRPMRELAGESVALTQPLSTCGYLATAHLLGSGGVQLQDTRYRYLEHHDDVALAVVRGEVMAGGLKTHIARKYAHLGLQALAETEPLPGFALVVNDETVSEEHRRELREALVRLAPGQSAADAERMAEWGESLRHGAQPVSNEDYDPVRRLRLGTPIPGRVVPDLPGRSVKADTSP